MDIPKVFGGKYQRGEEIASRGSSSVYFCSDTETSKSFAIKVFNDVIPLGHDYEEEFVKEVEKLKSIENPSVVPIVDGGVENNRCYLVMEYVEGRTLRELLKSHDGALNVEQALMLTQQLCTALESIRQADVVHAHLDTRAIIVEGDSLKLAGFFPAVIAKIRRSMTSADGFIVDPAYISPEQVSGSSEPDFRTDLYASGIILFEMLTGKKPFVAGNAFQAAMMRVSEEPPSPSMLNSALSPILDAAVVKALDKTPDGRFQSFADFVDAISAGSTGTTASHDSSQTIGISSSSGRIGSETIGVGISTDDIRKMLEERDSVVSTSASASSISTSDSNAMPKAATVGPNEDAKVSSPDGAETVVGQIDISDLPASFMLIDGRHRGKRFMIEEGQNLLGRDSSCNLCIDDKDVPSRYALIVKKEERFVIAPISTTPLVVNDVAIEADSEHTLIRGDIVKVGSSQLRYVAPGEVFTLQDDVADRAVDRAGSKIPAAVKLITVLVAVACVGLFFVFQQGITDRESAMKKAATSSAAKKKQVVAKLRQEGDSLYKEGKLVEPVGANARTRFEQILEIDPEDTYAKRRLDEIKRRVASMRQQRRSQQRQLKKIEQTLIQAKQYFERGDLVSPPGANAQDSYRSVLRLDPKNKTALAGLENIEKRLGSMLGQVNTLLVKAKQHRSRGRIVAPTGANAFESIKEIFRLNPGNPDAQELLIDMAAECIYRGDLYKRKASPAKMKNEYLKAQMLGVDPQFLAPRMRGADLMKKSSANVIIFDGGGSNEQSKAEDSEKGFLSTSEIQSRIASWKLKDQISGGSASDKFIELR